MALHYRTCPFCEATCGLEVETEGRDVVSVRGDEQDVLSHGFICPKAFGLKQLHEDPDRLTTPLVRRDGELVEATWDEAFEEIDRRLSALLSSFGSWDGWVARNRPYSTQGGWVSAPPTDANPSERRSFSGPHRSTLEGPDGPPADGPGGFGGEGRSSSSSIRYLGPSGSSY